MKIQNICLALLCVMLVQIASAQKEMKWRSAPPINSTTVLLKFRWHAQDAECGISPSGKNYQLDGVDMFQKIDNGQLLELATSCDFYPFEKDKLYYVTIEQRVNPDGQEKFYVKKAVPVVAYLSSLNRKSQTKNSPNWIRLRRTNAE